MLEGIHFSYDGITSVDMGLMNVKISGGMFEETFLPDREIKEKTISGRDKPYFQRVALKPLSFKLTFAFENYYDEAKIREVARWLMQSYYKPFYTVDNPDRVFYCMLEGDSTLVHNGLKQGYIELTMRCDSPYSYTQIYNNDNNRFYSTDLTNTVAQNTFNSGDGVYDNVNILNPNTIELDSVSIATWNMYSGMKWSDI